MVKSVLYLSLHREKNENKRKDLAHLKTKLKSCNVIDRTCASPDVLTWASLRRRHQQMRLHQQRRRRRRRRRRRHRRHLNVVLNKKCFFISHVSYVFVRTSMLTLYDTPKGVCEILTTRVSTIAPWYCLRLPSCGRGFESQAHHLCYFQFVSMKL